MKRLLAKLLDRFAFWAFGDDDLVAKIQDAVREEDGVKYCTRSMAAAICDGDLRTPLTATWAYSAGDPLAVHVSFSTGQTWRFARDLLRDGALTGAGQGDVVVTPVRHGVEVLFPRARGGKS